MSSARDQYWMEDATCTKHDPELFFPEREQGGTLARFICASCPVLEQCLAYALTDQNLQGIWGGLSYRERQTLRANLQGAAA